MDKRAQNQELTPEVQSQLQMVLPLLMIKEDFTKICTNKCLKFPGTSSKLENDEILCMKKCAERYMDVMKITAKVMR